MSQYSMVCAAEYIICIGRIHHCTVNPVGLIRNVDCIVEFQANFLYNMGMALLNEPGSNVLLGTHGPAKCAGMDSR